MNGLATGHIAVVAKLSNDPNDKPKLVSYKCYYGVKEVISTLPPAVKGQVGLAATCIEVKRYF